MQKPNNETIHLKHISYYNDDPIASFVPRIPKNRASNENDTTPRICVSTLLNGCLVAHPSVFYRFIERATEDPYEYMGNLQVLLEHGLSGMLFRVYHFEANQEDVFNPGFLHEQKYVGDAQLTHEHWILKESKPVAVTYLLLHEFETSASKPIEEWGIRYTEFNSLEEMGTIMEYLDLFDLARANGVADDEWFSKSFSKEESLALSQLLNQMKEKRKAEMKIHNERLSALVPMDHSTVVDEDLPF